MRQELEWGRIGNVVLCFLLMLAPRRGSSPYAADVPVPAASPGLKERLTGFRVGAHRGGLPAPDQNTIHHFEQARLAGVDIVETDLRASSDGEVFLFHDKVMEDITTCAGPIGSKTAAEIRGCRLKGTKLGLSTFRELLAWSAGRVVINAEFKSSSAIEPSVRLVREFDAYGWVYFQVDKNYARARALDSRVALLVTPKGPGAQQSLEHYLTLGDENLLIIELHEDIRTPKNIRAIHLSGKLASEDSWHFGQEIVEGFRRARCDDVFSAGIDIAITEMPEECVQERDVANRAVKH